MELEDSHKARFSGFWRRFLLSIGLYPELYLYNAWTYRSKGKDDGPRFGFMCI